MKRPSIIAVIGASEASGSLWDLAYQVGQAIAKQGWLLVCGGLKGVMEAASKGATETGGTVVGILPGPTTVEANSYVTISIATNMGHARGVIICHSADALIAIGGGEGTLSEIAIGRKLGKPVVGIQSWEIAGLIKVQTAVQAIQTISALLKNS